MRLAADQTREECESQIHFILIHINSFRHKIFHAERRRDLNALSFNVSSRSCFSLTFAFIPCLSSHAADIIESWSLVIYGVAHIITEIGSTPDCLELRVYGCCSMLHSSKTRCLSECLWFRRNLSTHVDSLVWKPAFPRELFIRAIALPAQRAFKITTELYEHSHNFKKPFHRT